jgi:hypothetical protein
MHLHYSLPSITIGGFENLGYGKYRNLVDLMQHKDLGDKTILFMLDGLWGGEGAESEPVKFQSTPFNGDWPNSIFVSQDHVALESVGLDFVRAEFDEYADMYGADDYLHQAADSANWADGIIYDPENDGVLMESMGVHEHWNNDLDKEYTRNLGTGDGIELVKYLMTGTEMIDDQYYMSVKTFPNPFSEHISFAYELPGPGCLEIHIFSVDGREVDVLNFNHDRAGKYRKLWNANQIPAGIYTYSVLRDGDKWKYASGKIIKTGH